jgi:archaellum component FlaC
MNKRKMSTATPSRKLNELDADIDDARTAVEELQQDTPGDSAEKLEELSDSLEDAANAIDELEEKDE